MKKLIYLILFIPVIGFGQTYPYQIEPDTTHRMIMMTDTSVIDSPALEFVYSSIDSLVRQITKDSLGLDSTYWSLDDSLSLSPINQTNNIVLGNLSGNTSMTGSYNFIAGFQLGRNLTTGGYNTIIGFGNASNITTSLNNTVIGRDNASNASGLSGSTLFGWQNYRTNTNSLGYSFMAGGFNFSSKSSGISDYNFANGFDNFKNASGRYNFVNGFRNLYTSTGVSEYNFFNGSQNARNTTGNIAYSFFNGIDNGYNVSSSTNSFLSGFRNIYSSTTSLSNTIAIGRENGYNSVDHSNSIYLGYRQGYTTGAANKLLIGMAQDDPLLDGSFSGDSLRINGTLSVRDKTGTAGNLAGFDGDQIVDSGIDASSVLTSEVDGSVTNELQTLSFSNPNLSISSGNTVSLSGINYWDYNGTTSEIYTTTNVGINTTNPSYDLDVIGDMRLSGIFYDGVSSSGSSGNIIENSFGEMRWVSKSSIGLSEFNNDLGLTSTPWTIAASDEIYFNTVGNDIVGINTISPTRNLQVNGTGYFSQDLEIVQDLKAVSATTSFEDTGGDRGVVGEIIARDDNGLSWWDKGIARGYEGTDNTTSASYVIWPPNSNYDSPVSDGLASISGKTITVSDDGWYRITVSGENQSTGQCNGAIYTTSAVYSQTIGTGHDNGTSYTPASFSMHWIGSYTASTSFTFRVYATSGSCILDNVVFSVEQIKKN